MAGEAGEPYRSRMRAAFRHVALSHCELIRRHRVRTEERSGVSCPQGAALQSSLPGLALCRQTRSLELRSSAWFCVGDRIRVQGAG